MNLKVTLAALATEKIAEKVKVNDSINTALNKIGKISGQKTANECIKEAKANCLIIKQKSYSLGTIAGMFAGKIPNMSEDGVKYQIYNTSNEFKYKVHTESPITSRENLTLYDDHGNKMGYIVEPLIPVGIPLIEKDLKSCSIYFKNQKIVELRKYVFSDKLQFETLEGNVEISQKEHNLFKICYNDDLIITAHYVPFNLKDDYTDKFVIEYDKPSYETIAILLSIALDLLKS